MDEETLSEFDYNGFNTRDVALQRALTHHARHGHVSETASPKETIETAALFLTFLTTGA